MTAQSYGYKHTLSAPVANLGSVAIPWPAEDADSGLVDETNYEVSVGGLVVTVAGEGAIAVFSTPLRRITVTNNSGETWKQFETVYVFCPRAPSLEGVDDQDVLLDHEARLLDHETRIAALEPPATALEARIAALEAAAVKGHSHGDKPHKPGK